MGPWNHCPELSEVIMENWFKEHPWKTDGDPDKQVAYHQTFYQSLRGRECLVDLRHYADLMKADTPEEARAKLSCQELMAYIKESAGIHESVELIAAEGAMVNTSGPTEQERINLLEPT